MIIFWRVLLAYLLIDFVLQPKKFYVKKFESIWLRLLHGFIFFILALILTRNYLTLTWINIFGFEIHGVGALLILSGLHILIDEIYRRRKAIIKSVPHTAQFVVHETAHLLAIFLLVPDYELNNILNLFPETSIILITALLFTAFFPKTLISAYEYDRFDSDYETSADAYISMLQRIIFFFLCLMPGYSWIIWCTIGLFFFVMLRKQRIVDVSNFNIIVSTIVSIVMGVLVRSQIYLWH
ncbi:hypothetical protein Dip510_000220 [Elusimicrobium posterum]|uniref:hypothetical protein n=1 Tax=Elusimicrobium posterum TaxID=3116653 RepID=UPI003C706C40